MGVLEDLLRDQMTHRSGGPGMPFGGVRERGSVLPVGRDEYGRNVFAQPQILRDLFDAVTLPGDVLAGRREPSVPDVTNLAMALTVGASGGSAPAGALRSGAARSGKGFRAYHGSPHDFDRFDISKIGTGEGAQAFGHGLYFADAEGVARSYRDGLSKPYYEPADGVNMAEKYGHDVASAFENVNGDPAELNSTIKRLREIVARNLDEFGASNVSELAAFVSYDGDVASTTIAMARRADNLEALLKSGDLKTLADGRMYEVNINADPADFLDWDKPLSEQPAIMEKMKAARSKYLRELANDPKMTAPTRDVYGTDIGPATGKDIASSLSVALDGRSTGGTKATTAMRKAGIPGIKYLDAGSRGAGDGSRNYVVFDDSLIEILRKYGLAGAAVAGAATGMGGGDARADDALMARIEAYLSGR